MRLCRGMSYHMNAWEVSRLSLEDGWANKPVDKEPWCCSDRLGNGSYRTSQGKRTDWVISFFWMVKERRLKRLCSLWISDLASLGSEWCQFLRKDTQRKELTWGGWFIRVRTWDLLSYNMGEPVIGEGNDNFKKTPYPVSSWEPKHRESSWQWPLSLGSKKEGKKFFLLWVNESRCTAGNTRGSHLSTHWRNIETEF